MTFSSTTTPMEERRIAQLEAENALLRQRMSAKDSHIAMLEDRLLKTSVELASSRAREDEQHLLYRQQQQKATTAAAEEDHKHTLIFTPPAPVRNSRRGGAAGIISNIIRLDRSERSLDKSDLSHDLSADYPSSLPAADGGGGLRRRSSLWSGSADTMMMDDDMTRPSTVTVASSQEQQQQQQRRRGSVIGQLFKNRKRISDYTAEEEEVEVHECEMKDEQQQQQQQQRRRPNRTVRQVSSRIISSTVAFPREEDDDTFGFE